MTKLLPISVEFIDELVKQELKEVLKYLEAEIEGTELDMEHIEVPEHRLIDYRHNVVYRNALTLVLKYYGE